MTTREFALSSLAASSLMSRAAREVHRDAQLDGKSVLKTIAHAQVHVLMGGLRRWREEQAR